MPDHLILRFDAPLQAWGDVALDPVRPTRAFPSLSALAGLLASALGWTYRDGARTTALQDSLRYAVREDRAPAPIRDYQTADLGRETRGWTRWGMEKRGGAFAKGTQILDKRYLAGGALTVAVTLRDNAPVKIDHVAAALERPARPLFLGRKSCPPGGPLLVGRVDAETPYAALERAPLAYRAQDPPLRCWYAEGEGPDRGMAREVFDRRDFVTDRFVGSRRVVEGEILVDVSEEVPT